jgi:hypothetical protein
MDKRAARYYAAFFGIIFLSLAILIYNFSLMEPYKAVIVIGLAICVTVFLYETLSARKHKPIAPN